MKRLLSTLLVLSAAAVFCAAIPIHDWQTQVPAGQRLKPNPSPETAPVLAAGAVVYADRCASCHGGDALGRGRRPSLRTARVQQATDGELLWLLENGELRYGMPSWSGLPEQQRWQVERYVKSLPAATP